MIRTIAIAGLGVTLLAATDARAGECHHGDSGGGGSSSSGSSSDSSSSSSSSSSSDSWSDSSSSSSSSSSSTTVDVVPACIDASDVLGEARCRDFGEGWAGRGQQPAVTLEVGTFVRTLRPGFGNTSGSMDHLTSRYAYKVIEPMDREEERATAIGLDLRTVIALRSAFYLGLDGELGGVVGEPSYDVEMTSTSGDGRASVETRQGLYVAGAGLLGVRGRLGGTTLSAEVAAGVRVIQLAVESHIGVCDITDHHYNTEPFVEPRVRLDRWVNPWMTMGVFAGGDAWTHSYMVGVGIGGHLRAFDQHR